MIHALLIQWKPDTSFEWRTRVASAVPILEEALYKQAKSNEDYRNPQSLEAQLLHILTHFEAGNGPFLLQGTCPLYSVRESSIDLALIKAYILHKNGISHRKLRRRENNELPLEKVSERAKTSAIRRFISESSASLEACSNKIEENLDRMESSVASLENERGSNSGNRFPIVFPNARKENSIRLRHEIGKVRFGTCKKENVVENSVSRDNVSHGTSCLREQTRKTLGVILQFSTPNEVAAKVSPCIHAVEASLAIRRDASGTRAETRKAASENAIVEAPNRVCVAKSETLNANGSSLVIVDEQGDTSAVTGVEIECVETNELSTNQEQGPHSDLSPSTSPSVSSGSSFASSSTTPFATPLSMLTCPTSLAPASSMVQSGTRCPSASNAALHPRHEAGDDRTSQTAANAQLQPLSRGWSTKQFELQKSTTQTQPEHFGADASTSSVSSRLVMNGTSSTSGGVKSTLRCFLANRDEYSCEYKSSASSFTEESYPWETWEETTEQLDGMCCVCMTGLKGAAFVPCGHTFCRRCSREVWRSRGTCPLCNRYIREILDIY
ncbi:hypothetical protein KP509_30G013200 [Ceratopteris richardii]|nr:hypothetical protein KP509_30G013200 [Ceratopteris richardii]